MESKEYVICLLILANSLVPNTCDKLPVISPNLFTQPSINIGECMACKIFVNSFEKGLERTSRGKYEGGDAAWEEEKLKKSYQRSEMRLIDIMDNICLEDSKTELYCHNIAEKAEDLIEEWWAENSSEGTDLLKHICIDGLKLCCPKHHYGKDCLPCLGDLQNLCNGNGRCRGDGTRKGNGTCNCDIGYTGDNCNVCSEGYYVSYQDQNKLLCSPCHKSCLGSCRQSTPKDCYACKSGYNFDVEEGCVDINECADLKVCKDNTFCVNEEGSYSCKECDKSCVGCYGDGPDLCLKCANGYLLKGDLCVRERDDENYDTLAPARDTVKEDL